jgi:hypothetical protein
MVQTVRGPGKTDGPFEIISLAPSLQPKREFWLPVGPFTKILEKVKCKVGTISNLSQARNDGPYQNYIGKQENRDTLNLSNDAQLVLSETDLVIAHFIRKLTSVHANSLRHKVLLLKLVMLV